MQQQVQGVVIESGQKPTHRLDGNRVKNLLLVDTYTDIFMSYVDAKMAASLYKGVPMKYALK